MGWEWFILGWFWLMCPWAGNLLLKISTIERLKIFHMPHFDWSVKSQAMTYCNFLVTKMYFLSTPIYMETLPYIEESESSNAKGSQNAFIRMTRTRQNRQLMWKLPSNKFAGSRHSKMLLLHAQVIIHHKHDEFYWI